MHGGGNVGAWRNQRAHAQKCEYFVGLCDRSSQPEPSIENQQASKASTHESLQDFKVQERLQLRLQERGE